MRRPFSKSHETVNASLANTLHPHNSSETLSTVSRRRTHDAAFLLGRSAWTNGNENPS